MTKQLTDEQREKLNRLLKMIEEADSKKNAIFLDEQSREDIAEIRKAI